MLQESHMGNLDSNNKPKQAIQKAGPENKTYEEVPPRTKEDIQQVCFFTAGEKRFCSKRTELIILDYMFGDCMIGVVQNIAFQVFNRNIILQNNFVVWICSSPLRNSPIEEADFGIRVPASVPDKFAAIIAAIHTVCAICIFLLGLSNTDSQQWIQRFVGIQA
jgi:hypothetical protein